MAVESVIGKRLKEALCASTALLPVRVALLAGLAGAAAGHGGTAVAQDRLTLPNGGVVAAGSAAIRKPEAGTMIVDQASDRAVVDWRGFDVGQDATVRFEQPNAGAITVNRVTQGGTSLIDGQVSANGQVVILNPSGVLIGPTGRIDAAGVVASTSRIDVDGFMAGDENLRFTPGGDPGAAVVNQGAITVEGAGIAALVAPNVENRGTVKATAGRVNLAAGDTFTLDLAGDGLVELAVTGAGQKLQQAGVVEGTTVVLSADAASDVVSSVINVSGITRATAIGVDGGAIVLDGGAGAVTISGEVDASAGQATGAGGTVTATGTGVTVASGAKVKADGASGGTVLLGGDVRGGKDAGKKLSPAPVPTARLTTIEAGATVSAKGTDGAGGNIVVWGDQVAKVSGSLLAGGTTAGGFIETSGLEVLIDDATVDAGVGGTWLTDPDDFVLHSGNAPTYASALDGGTNVLIETTASGTGGNGDIFVAVGGEIAWSSAATLELSAYRNIEHSIGASSAPFTALGDGHLILRADNSGIGIGSLGLLNAPSMAAGSTYEIFYNPSSYASPTAFSDGGAGTFNAYMLVHDVDDLQAMADNLAGTYALSKDIDASATAGWNGGAGFVPVGTEAMPFSGTLNGQGHMVSGLFIDNATANNVGLFGVAAGTIANLGLVDADITGSLSGVPGFLDVGALVGHSSATISNVFVTGTVTADGIDGSTGGIAGYSDGAITDSFSIADVNGGTRDNVGGIVGYSDGGALARTYAGGTVAGANNVGGLFGRAKDNAISDSYATAAVTGGSNVGGLIGYGESGVTLDWVYASGLVTGTGGALVGGGSVGTPTTAYWDSGTSGQGGAGTAATDVAADRYDHDTNYAGFDFTDVWYQIDSETRPMLAGEYATTIVAPHQLQMMALDPAADYVLAADIDLAGTADLADVWSDAGFVPVGDSDTAFSGDFDGQGHVVGSLFVDNATADDVGLFGVVAGTIANLGLVDVDITGAFDTGALAGTANGSIVNVHATGRVTGTAGGGSLGGLVGDSTANISRSWTNVTVDGDSSRSSTGGLVGSATNWIAESFALGSVSGGNNTGGLVGSARPYLTVSDTYATGAVSGGNNVGGLLGEARRDTRYGGVRLWRSYATGQVTGTNGVSGLIGYNEVFVIVHIVYENEIIDSYYDRETTGVTGGAGTGLTTAEFQTGTLLQGGVLPNVFGEGVWATDSGLYPYLTWYYPSGVQAVTGNLLGAQGAVTSGHRVSVSTGGETLASGYSGANGYYYAALPAGSLADGVDLLIYGADFAAARLATAGAGLVATEADLLSGHLIGATDVELLSALPDPSGLFAAADTIASGDDGAVATLAAIAGRVAFFAEGSAFSIDVAPTLSADFALLTAEAVPLSVDAAVTVPAGRALNLIAGGDLTVNAAMAADGGTLGLSAGGRLAVNAPITANDAAAVALGFDAADPANLMFRGGAALTFTGTGGSLSINGEAYTLLTSMAELDAIDGVDATDGSGSIVTATGRYALAQDLAADADYGRALIGTSGNRFGGIFEGLGHTITGLTVDTATAQNAGLFGSSTGTIRDLRLENVSINGGGDSGGLIGRAQGDTVVFGVHVDGTVTSNGSGVGGVIGSLGDSFYIGYTDADVDVTAPGGNHIGGLIGFSASGNGVATNVHAHGDISALGYAGGLFGSTYDGFSITDAYATGSVTGIAERIGGLIGSNSADLSRVYATGKVTGPPSVAGGLIGYADGSPTLVDAYFDIDTTDQTVSAGGTGLGTGFDSPYALASYGAFDFDTVWYISDGNTRPILRSEHTLTIRNSHDLQLIALDRGADYVLAADIDFGAAFADGADMWNPDGAGFTPLGSGIAYFKGSLDGGGHVIDGLIVHANTGNAGLFATTYDAELSDLVLSNVSITAPGHAGGLLGRGLRGTMITNVEVTGTVAAGAYGGGVAGLLTGDITDAVADVTVTGGRGAGGLVGLLDSDSHLLRGTASGTVSGDSALGGLVGRLRGTVTQGTANGDVTGTGIFVGGLVGFGEGGTVTDSLATGAVEGNRNVGGLVGTLSGMVSDSTAQGDVTGVRAVGGLVGLINPGGVVLRGTANGAVEGSSILGGLVGQSRGIVTEGTAHGAVTATGNYAGGLVGFSDQGAITDGLATGAVTGDSYVGGLAGLLDVAVVGGTATGAVAGDTFVGGLVGRTFASVTDAMASGDVEGARDIGGLVGFGGATATITNSTALGDVTALVNGGGLAGEMYGTVANSRAAGTVQAEQGAGGLVGRLDGLVRESYAEGAVVSGLDYTGGLVGHGSASARIEDSYATSAVWTTRYGGGLAGRMRGTVDGAFASGLVHGGDGMAGGLIGWRERGAVVNDAYWNMQTSGVMDGVGVGTPAGQGLDAAALSSGLPGGLDDTLWGHAEGISHPYLKWRFATGPAVASGTAQAGAAVALAIDGERVGTAVAGADGRFYLALDAEPADGMVLAWYDDWMVTMATGVEASSLVGAAAADLEVAGASDLALADQSLRLRTALGSQQALSGALAGAAGELAGPAALFDASGGDLVGVEGISFEIHATAAAFDLDGTLSTRGTGTIDLFLDGADARLDLTGTVSSEAAGYGAVIVAPRIFDQGGAFALAPDGYFLIYGAAPEDSELGSLGATATIFGATRADLAPGEGATAGLQNWLIWSAPAP
ncbi:filamentous hemagglutinin N-terminal domain-containing protein [Zavarzinia compransoris]|uniref:two-partner secretion domain-containing protein n=1 Tax=Zavarzinia marina TaxID=2911065 RepID=UPI001F3DE7F0|nr:GLUG motif-containing protein [Zavarzinia marina]MCF4165508.1 filamentous hemagglutinin N-terminal domain-containing protein [Zavarzinia marina]